MKLAPYNLCPTDGGVVIWYEHKQVGAVKLSEITNSIDGPRCAQFKCCYHQHYLAIYEDQHYKCHLWEFLDLKPHRLTKTQIEARQDDLAATLLKFEEEILNQNVVPKCIGCGLLEWLSNSICPICQSEGDSATARACTGCSVRMRIVNCDHSDTITHPPCLSQPKPISAMDKKRAEKRQLAESVLLEGGSPASETLSTRAAADKLTPGAKCVRRALDISNSLEPNDYPELSPELGSCAGQSPRSLYEPNLLDLDYGVTQRDGVDENSAIPVPLYSEIKRNQEALLENQQSIMVKVNQILRLISPSERSHHDTRNDEERMPQASFRIRKYPEIVMNEDIIPTGILGNAGCSEGAAPTSAPLPRVSFDFVPDSELRQLNLTVDSRSDMSLKLLRMIFDEGELIGHNCSGTRGKKKLDPVRLEYIKSMVLRYKVLATGESEKKAWRPCRRGIDSWLRRITIRVAKSLEEPEDSDSDNSED